MQFKLNKNKIESLTINKVVGIRENKNSDPCEVKMDIVFDGCELEKVIELAVRSAVITEQSRLRKLSNFGEYINTNPTVTIDVSTLGGREKLSDSEKAARLVNKLSPEQKAEMLKMLTAK